MAAPPRGASPRRGRRAAPHAASKAAVRAVEANLWAMHRDFARVPGAQVHDEPGLMWFTMPSRSSWLNGASRTDRDHNWFTPFAHLTLGEGPCRLFVGRVDGRPVACSLAFIGGGAVGLYGVGTVPELRGRGYGSAATLAGIDWGRDQGVDLAILHASELGEPVYRRLGFETACEVSQWMCSVPDPRDLAHRIRNSAKDQATVSREPTIPKRPNAGNTMSRS